MEIYKPVKDLKCLCIETIVDAYKIDIDYRSLFHVNNTILAFQKLKPSFSKWFIDFNEKDTFGKFLWFVYHFVWNSSTKKYYLTDKKETVMTNWLSKESELLGEISFVGCEYLNKKLFFGPAFSYNNYPNFIKHKLSPQMINNQSKLPEVVKNKQLKLLSLSVVNCRLISWPFRSFSIFFDIDKGILFEFYQTIKYLGHPAFLCKAELYYYFMLEILEGVDKNCHFYEEKSMSTSSENHLSILKTVSCNNNKKYKKGFRRLYKALEQLIFLEEIELSLLKISDKQKKKVIKSLNQRLKSFKIVFVQPINFLLYIGKRFENLQTLEVAFLGITNISSKYSKYFNRLSKGNLLIFQNLKYFKLDCNWIAKPCPFLLSTILTILTGCQKTLITFKLERYLFSDVEKIVDFIYSKKISLEYISFKYVGCLVDKDVMKLAKLENCKGMLIKIDYCQRITRNGITASLEHISQNNLNKRILSRYS